MIAAVHAPLWSTLPVAIVAALIVILVWRRTGRHEYLRPRDRVRRLGMIGILLFLPMAVIGLSVVDARGHQLQYLLVWSAAILLTFLVVLISLADAMLTVRLERRQAQVSFGREVQREVARRQTDNLGRGEDRA